MNRPITQAAEMRTTSRGNSEDKYLNKLQYLKTGRDLV